MSGVTTENPRDERCEMALVQATHDVVGNAWAGHKDQLSYLGIHFIAKNIISHLLVLIISFGCNLSTLRGLRKGEIGMERSGKAKVRSQEGREAVQAFPQESASRRAGCTQISSGRCLVLGITLFLNLSSGNAYNTHTHGFE